MLKWRRSNRFEKDYHRMEKRGYDMTFLDEALDSIVLEETLDKRYRKHALDPKIVSQSAGKSISAAHRATGC